LSTKDRIKRTGFFLFAKNGYAGTSMNDIAREVGINKASLYSHYASKEDIFLSIYEDVACDYELLYERIIEESKDFSIEKKLHYIFFNYIRHFYQNPDLQSFWNQLNYYTPPEIHEKYYNNIYGRHKKYADIMIRIFEEAVKLGVLRKGDPEQMHITYWAMCEGALSVMLAVKVADEQWINNFWADIWNGLKGGKNK